MSELKYENPREQKSKKKEGISFGYIRGHPGISKGYPEI